MVFLNIIIFICLFIFYSLVVKYVFKTYVEAVKIQSMQYLDKKSLRLIKNHQPIQRYYERLSEMRGLLQETIDSVDNPTNSSIKSFDNRINRIRALLKRHEHQDNKQNIIRLINNKAN